MASGKNHDRAIWFCTPVIGTAVSIGSGLDAGVIAAVSHLVMGLYGSPDLDIKSRPFLRWRALKVLWKPYQHFIPRHRHWLSHGPFVGTLVRIVYAIGLISIPWFVWVMISYWQQPTLSFGQVVAQSLIPFRFVESIPIRYWLWSFVGAEMSAWNHIVLDGWLVPLPPTIRNRLK